MSWRVKVEERAVLLEPPPYPRFHSPRPCLLGEQTVGSLPTSSPCSHSPQEVPSLPVSGLTVLDVQVGQKCLVHPERFVYVS